jgi:hypothetical protein
LHCGKQVYDAIKTARCRGDGALLLLLLLLLLLPLPLPPPLLQLLT